MVNFLSSSLNIVWLWACIITAVVICSYTLSSNYINSNRFLNQNNRDCNVGYMYEYIFTNSVALSS